MVRDLLFCIAFLCFVPIAAPQQATVDIHIRLVNGLNGRPWKLTAVGFEVSPGYRNLTVQTDPNGLATITVPKDATIYAHNTNRYVACADEAGGLIHNDFKVSQILGTGIVQPVGRPNRCSTTSAIPVPGDLVIFVRPWRFLENSFL